MNRILPIVTMLLFTAVGTPAPAEQEPGLELFLGRMMRVAELYRDNALSFSCDETIYYTGRSNPILHKFTYIYRYSKDRMRLEDYRILRGRASRMPDKKKEKIALDNYGLPSYMLRAYSWVFVFEAENQPFYSFKIEGTEQLFGRKAHRVLFEPIPPVREGINDWYGHAFIDAESYQLLEVEAVYTAEIDQVRLLDKALQEPWDPDDIDGYRGTYTFSTYRTEFDIEKNGMRFPGRVLIHRNDHIVTGRSSGASVREEAVYQINQTYKRYHFFSVRTAEQVNEFVMDGSR